MRSPTIALAALKGREGKFSRIFKNPISISIIRSAAYPLPRRVTTFNTSQGAQSPALVSNIHHSKILIRQRSLMLLYKYRAHLSLNFVTLCAFGLLQNCSTRLNARSFRRAAHLHMKKRSRERRLDEILYAVRIFKISDITRDREREKEKTSEREQKYTAAKNETEFATRNTKFFLLLL